MNKDSEAFVKKPRKIWIGLTLLNMKIIAVKNKDIR